MYPGEQDDPTRMMPPQQEPRAYSQAGWQDQRSQGGWQDQRAQGGYPAESYQDAGGRGGGRGRRSAGPGVDIGKFAGSVVAMAVVAAIAGWLAAWVVDALYQRFGHDWANGGNTPTMFAVYGAFAALLAGVLWYLLLVGTPAPGRFFQWITGLLLVAAVVLPLLLVSPFLDALAASLVHLAIGLPIMGLTGVFGTTFRR